MFIIKIKTSSESNIQSDFQKKLLISKSINNVDGDDNNNLIKNCFSMCYENEINKSYICGSLN